ncbi:MAG: 23S rRNA (uracil(1939)-C(5))-methyltransferase RlmD [Candidatus Sericytochromatia bacterium]|nr:23S rRNA (uracil(1939)-C(5))-methyltransferase RlmD [Candidatus Sericytochromatia bacterium]
MHTPPVTVGERLTLTIEGLAPGGEGIARHEGYVVFVPDSAPGDLVRAKLITVRQNYGRALIERIETAGDSRVTPDCPVATVCGGCQWMHVTDTMQRSEKERQVRDALVRIGGLGTDEADALVRPIIGMTHPYTYRNKAQYPVGRVGKQLIMGYYRQRTHEIIPMDRCAVVADPMNRALRVARDVLQAHSVHAYDEMSGRGQIRHLVARYAYATGQVLVGLAPAERLPQAEAIATAIMAAAPDVVGVLENLNNRKTNAIFGPQTRLLAGASQIEEILAGLRFRIGLTSFFQINPPQAEKLYEAVAEFAGLQGHETVIDAYAGAATIALYLARQAREVIGIESNEQAVADAIGNIDANLAANCTMELGEVETVLPRLLAEGIRPDVVVLDPPRGGCDPAVLQALIAADVRRIAYASCSPSTFARDAKLLLAAGYRLTGVQPIDMFPQTFHVELAAGFSKP